MNTRSISPFWRFVLGLILLSSLVLTETTPASAAFRRCYVKANAAGLNNGTSWANAYRSLQSTLGLSTCTEVWVAKGTYKPTKRTNSSDPRSATFQLKNGVAIYGGFAGTETVLTQRKPALNPTILSGNIGSTAVATDNTYHVVTGSNTDNTARLDGFTITAGKADGTSSPDWFGAGMLIDAGSPNLKNLILSGNQAEGQTGRHEKCSEHALPRLEPQHSSQGKDAGELGAELHC